MKKFPEVSTLALIAGIIGFAAVSGFSTAADAALASQGYVERKANVSESAAADVGKIAIYAADGSGQKIIGGILANTILTQETDPTVKNAAIKIAYGSTATAAGNFATVNQSNDTTLTLHTVANTGSYNDLEDTPTIPGAYTLPAATSAALGGVKLGSNTVQNIAAATPSTTSNRTYAVQPNSSGQMVVNVPWVDTNTTYTLPTATDTVLGGVKLGSNTVQTVSATTPTTTASRTYAVQPNSSGQMVVNVPWVDTDTDTNTAASLSTTSTTALSTSASESLLSGAVSLHKIAKTGTYSDLIGAPSIPAAPSACTSANATCSLNYGLCAIGQDASNLSTACSSAKYYWELIVR
jgi:hypothetical protein